LYALFIFIVETTILSAHRCASQQQNHSFLLICHILLRFPPWLLLKTQAVGDSFGCDVEKDEQKTINTLPE
jgi:hypothetical protein